MKYIIYGILAVCAILYLVSFALVGDSAVAKTSVKQLPFDTIKMIASVFVFFIVVVLIAVNIYLFLNKYIKI
jgi:hypothetical protein